MKDNQNLKASDTELLDWLEEKMTNDNNFCEIYFAGLRNFSTGKAGSFQIESSPEKFRTIAGNTIREAILKAMEQEYEN